MYTIWFSCLVESTDIQRTTLPLNRTKQTSRVYVNLQRTNRLYDIALLPRAHAGVIIRRAPLKCIQSAAAASAAGSTNLTCQMRQQRKEPTQQSQTALTNKKVPRSTALYCPSHLPSLDWEALPPLPPLVRQGGHKSYCGAPLRFFHLLSAINAASPHNFKTDYK